MMKYKIILKLLSFVLFIGNGYSQNNAIFSGGNGDGFSESSIEQILNSSIFGGGNGDGFDVNSIQQILNSLIFAGGDGDGFGISTFKQQLNNSIFVGGDSDGFDRITIQSIAPFIWSGTIGTSWTVSGNWIGNTIPDIDTPVIIPDGVPNWPFVNAGLLSIGDNPNNGNFKCASLWIQENAFLQTRVNCRVENYGLLQIDGEMRVKKITSDAFQNFETGIVVIGNEGELKIKP